MLVSCFRHSMTMSSSNPRRWQGASTTEYREYSEEKQRSQRRGGPATLSGYVGNTTLEDDPSRRHVQRVGRPPGAKVPHQAVQNSLLLAGQGV